jgi:hypothetical protein
MEYGMLKVETDGAMLTNMYLKGIKPICFKNSIYSLDHNKIERFNFFENLSEYVNNENWGMNNSIIEKNENLVIYR